MPLMSLALIYENRLARKFKNRFVTCLIVYHILLLPILTQYYNNPDCFIITGWNCLKIYYCSVQLLCIDLLHISPNNIAINYFFLIWYDVYIYI